jgi:hypothetical protein
MPQLPPPSSAATGKASAPTKPAAFLQWLASSSKRTDDASRRGGSRCANSGDTAGGRARVVGYGAWMIEDPAAAA